MRLEYDHYDMIRAAVGEAHRSSNGWYRTNCPMCLLSTGKDDKRQSLGFRPKEGIFKCFRCGTKGVLREDFTSMSEGDPEEEEREPGKEFEPPEGYFEVGIEPGLSASVSKDARKYLKSRGTTPAGWRACRIGITLKGYFADRIILPVIQNGIWRGYIGRVWDEEDVDLKYQYPKGMSRGELLWNHDILLEKTDMPAVIVEGGFDGLPHYECAVGCLGKPAHKQYTLLLAAKRPLVVALDGDAWREAEALSMKLRFDGKRATFLRLPPRTDPGNVPPGELLDRAVLALRRM